LEQSDHPAVHENHKEAMNGNVARQKLDSQDNKISRKYPIDETITTTFAQKARKKRRKNSFSVANGNMNKAFHEQNLGNEDYIEEEKMRKLSRGHNPHRSSKNNQSVVEIEGRSSPNPTAHSKPSILQSTSGRTLQVGDFEKADSGILSSFPAYLQNGIKLQWVSESSNPIKNEVLAPRQKPFASVSDARSFLERLRNTTVKCSKVAAISNNTAPKEILEPTLVIVRFLFLIRLARQGKISTLNLLSRLKTILPPELYQEFESFLPNFFSMKHVLAMNSFRATRPSLKEKLSESGTCARTDIHIIWDKGKKCVVTRPRSVEVRSKKKQANHKKTEKEIVELDHAKEKVTNDKFPTPDTAPPQAIDKSPQPQLVSIDSITDKNISSSEVAPNQGIEEKSPKDIFESGLKKKKPPLHHNTEKPVPNSAVTKKSIEPASTKSEKLLSNKKTQINQPSLRKGIQKKNSNEISVSLSTKKTPKKKRKEKPKVDSKSSAKRVAHGHEKNSPFLKHQPLYKMPTSYPNGKQNPYQHKQITHVPNPIQGNSRYHHLSPPAAAMQQMHGYQRPMNNKLPQPQLHMQPSIPFPIAPPYGHYMINSGVQNEKNNALSVQPNQHLIQQHILVHHNQQPLAFPPNQISTPQNKQMPKTNAINNKGSANIFLNKQHNLQPQQFHKNDSLTMNQIRHGSKRGPASSLKQVSAPHHQPIASPPMQIQNINYCHSGNIHNTTAKVPTSQSNLNIHSYHTNQYGSQVRPGEAFRFNPIGNKIPPVVPIMRPVNQVNTNSLSSTRNKIIMNDKLQQISNKPTLNQITYGGKKKDHTLFAAKAIEKHNKNNLVNAGNSSSHPTKIMPQKRARLKMNQSVNNSDDEVEIVKIQKAQTTYWKYSPKSINNGVAPTPKSLLNEAIKTKTGSGADNEYDGTTKPEKAKNPFTHFCRMMKPAIRSELSQKHRNASMNHMKEKIQEETQKRWRALRDEEKQVFVHKSVLDFNRFELQMRRYKEVQQRRFQISLLGRSNLH